MSSSLPMLGTYAKSTRKVKHFSPLGKLSGSWFEYVTTWLHWPISPQTLKNYLLMLFFGFEAFARCKNPQNQKEHLFTYLYFSFLNVLS